MPPRRSRPTATAPSGPSSSTRTRKFSNGEAVTAQSFIDGWTRAAQQGGRVATWLPHGRRHRLRRAQRRLGDDLLGPVGARPHDLRRRAVRAGLRVRQEDAADGHEPGPQGRPALRRTRPSTTSRSATGPSRWKARGSTTSRSRWSATTQYSGQKANLDRVEVTILNSENALHPGVQRPQGRSVRLRPHPTDPARPGEGAVRAAGRLPQRGQVRASTTSCRRRPPRRSTRPTPARRSRTRSTATPSSAVSSRASRPRRRRFIPPCLQGQYYSEGVCESCVKQDPAKAKEFAAKAGLTPGTTINLSFNTGGGHEEWVQAVAAQLQDVLGVKVNVTGVPFKELLQNEKKPGRHRPVPLRLGRRLPDAGQLPVPADGHHGDQPGAAANVVQGDNAARYSNPAFDQLLVQERAAKTDAERVADHQAGREDGHRRRPGPHPAVVPHAVPRRSTPAKCKNVELDFFEDPTLTDHQPEVGARPVGAGGTPPGPDGCPRRTRARRAPPPRQPHGTVAPACRGHPATPAVPAAAAPPHPRPRERRPWESSSSAGCCRWSSSCWARAWCCSSRCSSSRATRSAASGEKARDPAVIAQLREKYGLDEPLPVQYVHYVEPGRAARRPRRGLRPAALGQRGAARPSWSTPRSSRWRRSCIDIADRPVRRRHLRRLPLQLLGRARHRHARRWRSASRPSSSACCCRASSASSSGSCRSSGRTTGWRSYVMPAFTLAIVDAALVARLMRGTMLEVLRADYIRTATAKGLSRSDGHPQARAAQLDHPGRHLPRHLVRHAARRRPDHRGHLQLGRHRLGADPRDRHAEPADHRRGRHLRRRHLRPAEPARRHRLRLPGPADPARVALEHAPSAPVRPGPRRSREHFTVHPLDLRRADPRRAAPRAGHRRRRRRPLARHRDLRGRRAGRRRPTAPRSRRGSCATSAAGSSATSSPSSAWCSSCCCSWSRSSRRCSRRTTRTSRTC